MYFECLCFLSLMLQPPSRRSDNPFIQWNVSVARVRKSINLSEPQLLKHKLFPLPGCWEACRKWMYSAGRKCSKMLAVIIIISTETVFYLRPTSVPGGNSGPRCLSPWNRVLLHSNSSFSLHQGYNRDPITEAFFFLCFILLEGNAYSKEMSCVIVCLWIYHIYPNLSLMLLI